MPAVIYLFGMTWKVRYVGRENADKVGKPAIWAFWHSRLLPLVYFYRKQNICVLTSKSFDGEVISIALHRLGFGTVRGSTTRGGARSLIEIIRELEKGTRVAFTPDGPRGPKEIAQIGAAAASAHSGVPIIAAATASNKYWKLKSWDEFKIPRPFATVEIRQSEPIYPNGRSADEINAELQKMLDSVTALSDNSFKRN